MEMGAGTFHPATFLRALGPEPWRTAYVQGCRRPTDGRYGANPNRLQHYYQYQVLLKPAPADIQSLYLQSLSAIGLDLRRHDVRFVEDNWESPTLGAWGLGWEVWLNGMEITQFTYFQQVGGIACSPVSGEISYGLERLAMYLQDKDSVYELLWSDGAAASGQAVRYGELFQRNERELSRYNFEESDPKALVAAFDQARSACQALVERELPVPAYEQVLRASHCFNLLEARGTLSVGERQRYMLNVRQLAQAVAQCWCGDAATEQATPSRARSKLSTAPKHSATTDLATGPHCCLVELGCEELPALQLRAISEAFAVSMASSLCELGVGCQKIERFATPRRLGLLLHGLPERVPRREILGPPAEQLRGVDGEPLPAALGFARKNARSVEELVLRDTAKGKRLALPAPGSEEELSEVLCQRVENALLCMARDYPIRSMRWDVGTDDAEEYSFSRPVRWALLMLDDKPLTARLFGLNVEPQSYGHRVHAPKPLRLKRASDYAKTLRDDGYVIADFDARIEEIRHQIEEITVSFDTAAEARLERDDAARQLLEEVAAICEWPMAQLCQFEPRFLDMPAELLRIVLQKQQRYFPLWHRDSGEFLPQFVVIGNLDSNAPEEIVAGNERVVRARLEDALFFYQNDLKVALEQRREGLRARVFQEGLGSLYDKTQRLESLVEQLMQLAGQEGPEIAVAQRAARLCKSDLDTELVREFPELQGIIGAHLLARHTLTMDNPDNQVLESAKAIREHYRSPFSGTVVGSSCASQALAIADRLDSLVGHFAKGNRPSGSGDPFALRPAALGVLANLLADADLAASPDTPPPRWAELEIMRISTICAKGFENKIFEARVESGGDDSCSHALPLVEFFIERLRSFCRQELQIGSECFNAILASPLHRPHIYPVAFVCCSGRLSRFLADHTEQAKAMVAAWKRATKLLRKGAPQPLGKEAADGAGPGAQHLLDAVLQFRSAHPVAPGIAEGGAAAWRWSCLLDQRLVALGELATPLADFMDHTLVLAEAPGERAANLYALQQLEGLFSEVADFSQLSL